MGKCKSLLIPKRTNIRLSSKGDKALSIRIMQKILSCSSRVNLGQLLVTKCFPLKVENFEKYNPKTNERKNNISGKLCKKDCQDMQDGINTSRSESYCMVLWASPYANHLASLSQ